MWPQGQYTRAGSLYLPQGGLAQMGPNPKIRFCPGGPPSKNRLVTDVTAQDPPPDPQHKTVSAHHRVPPQKTRSHPPFLSCLLGGRLAQLHVSHVSTARLGSTSRLHVSAARLGCTPRLHVSAARLGCTSHTARAPLTVCLQFSNTRCELGPEASLPKPRGLAVNLLPAYKTHLHQALPHACLPLFEPITLPLPIPPIKTCLHTIPLPLQTTCTLPTCAFNQPNRTQRSTPSY